MKFVLSRYCLLLAICLSLSACTETIVYEVPEDTTNASTDMSDGSASSLEPTNTTIDDEAETSTTPDTLSEAPLAAQPEAQSVVDPEAQPAAQLVTQPVAQPTAPPVTQPVVSMVATIPPVDTAAATATTAVPSTTNETATAATTLPSAAQPATTTTPAAQTTDLPSTSIASPGGNTAAPETAATPTLAGTANMTGAVDTASELADVEAAATAAGAAGSDTAIADATETTTDTATDTATTNTTNTATNTTAQTPADIATEAATLMPEQEVATSATGASIDCEQTVPCSWLSSDSQFTVTITNTDNIGSQGRLTIQYHVTTSHDTDVQIINADPAIDINGSSYAPYSLVLGESVGGLSQGVLAGEPVQAMIEFDRTSSAKTLSSWSIGLSDSGLTRIPVFTNIPIGSATELYADCAYTLPCVWQSPLGDTTISLLSVSALGSLNQLTTNISIQTDKTTVVAVDSGATAVGIEGQAYTARTHAIGVQTGSDKLTTNTIPGATISAAVYFFRTLTVSPDLQELSLIVYEDQPVPRWNPKFISVPIQ